MTARLTMMCSGATAATRLASFPLDEPLDRERLPGFPVSSLRADRVLSGPELRARQTAALVADAATVSAQLRDCDYGAWAGRRLGDLAQEQPEAFAAWLADAAVAPHGGESLAALFTRVGAFMDQVLVERGHVLAITHAAVIRAAILHVLAAPFAAFWRIDVTPMSTTAFSSDARRWTLRTTGAPLIGGGADTRP